MLLVAIEPGDTSSFCDKMLEMIPDKKGIVVISLQRGVKGHSNLKSKLELTLNGVRFRLCVTSVLFIAQALEQKGPDSGGRFCQLRCGPCSEIWGSGLHRPPGRLYTGEAVEGHGQARGGPCESFRVHQLPDIISKNYHP